MYNYLLKHSLVRENIIRDLLFSDLKSIAAEKEYFLQCSIPNVDKDGFDIVVDGDFLFRKFQVKTFMENATTRSWEIHKSILRPARHIAQRLRFEDSPTGVGINGGVIIIEVIVGKNNTIKLKYYYTELIIILLIQSGFFKTTQTSKVIAKKFIKDLISDNNKTVNVNRSLLIPLRDNLSLMTLAGYITSVESNIYDNMFDFYTEYLKNDIDGMKPFYKIVKDTLKKLSKPKSLVFCKLKELYDSNK